MLLTKCQILRRIGNRLANSNSCACGDHGYPNQIGRNIHTSLKLCIDYYDALGLTPSATQQQIKTAYYKLSMLYHPDKNKGSGDAARKFRDIAEAYEILGNFRARKLYDKGIFTGGTSPIEPEAEDDPQTKFYKARMKRSEVPRAAEAQTIYNFNEWSRAHYGHAFERHKTAKAKYERLLKREERMKFGVQNEIVIFGIFTCLIIFLTISLYDNPDVNRIEKHKRNS